MLPPQHQGQPSWLRVCNVCGRGVAVMEVQVWWAALLQLRVPGPGVAGAPGGVHARAAHAEVLGVWWWWPDGGQAQGLLVPGRALLLPRVPAAGVARAQGDVLFRIVKKQVIFHIFQVVGWQVFPLFYVAPSAYCTTILISRICYLHCVVDAFG